MKNEKIIFAACSEVKTESSGTWFQTFPAYGRYAVGGIIKGADPKAEFIFDEAAAKEIITNFREAMAKADWPGVLVDREHFSADREKTSDAMAWAKDIRQEADGSIWTRWEFTAPGRELWEGKVLISRSPLFACTREGINFRPFRLESIGMTNTPHFKELSTLAAAKAAGKESGMKFDMESLVAAARVRLAACSDGECHADNPSKCRVHGTPDHKDDDTKINDWDDPKTRKMKERLAKMRAKNESIRKELADRRANIEKTKTQNASLQNDIRKSNVDAWKNRAQLKDKLSSMLKNEAVSVKHGGNPNEKDVIHFNYRGQQYYVPKNSEHLVKQFEESGLVKRNK